MNAFVWWMVQNSITVAVILPLVMIGCRLFRERPAVQHLLWLVVLLKLVTPPIVTWSVVLEDVGTQLWALSQTASESPNEPQFSGWYGQLQKDIAMPKSGWRSMLQWCS